MKVSPCRRLQLIRIISKINNVPQKAEKLGIRDVSFMREKVDEKVILCAGRKNDKC